MKILLIMKRFGANKDMVMENFGRQVRLFEPLAKKHGIDFFCPDYTKNESKIISRNGIKYIVKPISLFSLISFYNSLKQLIKNEKYDVIVATTDPLIGILSHHFSKKYDTPFVYDLQDNFEIYSSYKLPFVRYFDRKAIKNADIVFAVSENLKGFVSGFRKKPVYVVQNGVDLSLFKKIDKKSARKKLGLPLSGKIVIYVGEIGKAKGANIMLDAFEKVRKITSDAYLFLSGKVQSGINIKGQNIIFKELPERSDVVTALNSADVALIPNLESPFSKYCFPYKVLEYMAMGLPIVATDVGDVSLLLKKYPGSLCTPNDAEDMAEKIISRLKKPGKVNYSSDVKKLEWEVLAKKVEGIISKLI